MATNAGKWPLSGRCQACQWREGAEGAFSAAERGRPLQALPGGACKSPVEQGLRTSYIAPAMLRRFFTAFLALFALGALADSAAAKPFPSLAKRPSETRDRTPPAPQAIVPAAPDPQLVAQVEGLAEQIARGEAAFRARLDTGRTAVASAERAAPSSEAWVNAQVAISALDNARYDSVAGLAGLDSLYVDRQDNADAARVMADLAAIDPVRRRALAAVDAQNDALDGLRRALQQP